MPEPAWKAFERWVAKLFGSERNPLSGGNGKHSRSDSLHPSLFLSCKHSRGDHAKLFSLVEEESCKAEAEDKIPVVVIGRSGRGRNRERETLIVIRAGDFRDFLDVVESS